MLSSRLQEAIAVLHLNELYPLKLPPTWRFTLKLQARYSRTKLRFDLVEDMPVLYMSLIFL